MYKFYDWELIHKHIQHQSLKNLNHHSLSKCIKNIKFAIHSLIHVRFNNEYSNLFCHEFNQISRLYSLQFFSIVPRMRARLFTTSNTVGKS